MRSYSRLRTIFSAMLMSLICAVSGSAYAQSITDLSKLDVNSMPETTIKSYAEKAKAQGLSLDDVLNQFSKRGAGPGQISILRVRLARYFSGGSARSKSTKTSAPILTNTASEDEIIPLETSVRETPMFTHEDSLIFGFRFFNKKGLTFEPSYNMVVGDDYVLGAGDILKVNVYGASHNSYELEVSKTGDVYINMIGNVSVGGKSFKDAKIAINSALRRNYNDLGSTTHTSIQMVEVQPVTVSVVGEVFLPGTYSVASTSSLFNVLYLSGGPNTKGSYRDVQLIRGGKIIAHLDIYDFLVNQNAGVNVKLANGDIIFIPTCQKRVSVGGEFKNVGYFEAKDGETISDIIRYTGGYTTKALTSRLKLYRYGMYRREIVDIVDPDKMKVENGDSLAIAKLDDVFVENWVSLNGAVRASGVYPFTEGLTLKDFIEKSGGVLRSAYLDRGLVSRRKNDFTLTSLNFDVNKVLAGEENIALQPYDEVTILSIDDTRQHRTVSINGAVNTPGRFDYMDNLTVSDLILKAGGLQENASTSRVEVKRRLSEAEKDQHTDFSGHVIKLVITRDLALGNADNSFKLEPFDEVVVRTVPSLGLGGSIRLTGAVVSPGIYGYVDKEVHLTDIIDRSGGLYSTANIDGAHIFRRIRLLYRERAVKLYQSEARDDTAFYLRNNATHFELVSVDLRKAMENPGSKYDIKLANDDEIVIPELDQTVRIMGKVQNPSSTTWIKGWSARKYIKNSGGFSAKAKKRKTYVVYPNGQSRTVSHVLFFRKYPDVTPGSEIIVPARVERPPLTIPTIISMIGGGLSSVAVMLTVFFK